MPKRDEMMKRQQVLADFGEFAIRSEDLDEILGEACRLVGDALGTGRAKVLEIQEGGDELLVRAGVGWKSDVVEKVRLQMDERSSETYSIRKGEPVYSRDIAKEDRFDVPAFMKDAGVVALVNVPIFVPGQRPYGILQVDDTEPRAFGEDEIQFLRTYSMILGPVIDRLHLVEERSRARERLRAVLDSIGEGFALLGPDFTILDVNRETERLDGRTHEQLVGTSHWEAFPGTEASIVGETFRRVLREQTPAAVEHLYAWPGKRAAWLEMRAYPTRDGGIAVFWRDVTESKCAREALRESEEKYRTLFESMDEAYAVVEVLKDAGGAWSDFRFVDANPAFLAHTAMPYPVGKTATELLGTPNPRWAQLYGEALDSGSHLRVEETEPTLSRIFDLNIFSLDRARDRVAVLFTDITARRALEERQKVLIAELQHRTRNLIGVVRSMADKTVRSSDDLEDFRGRFRDRLEALARVQGLLSRLHEHDRVTFDALIETELSALDDGVARTTLEGPKDVRLRSSTVQTLALALHELATNALKYGALGQPDGRLSIRWWVEPDGADGRPWLHIDWRESGVAMPPAGSAPRGTGQGRELIERALPYQLGARTHYAFEPTGVHCTIAVPASASTEEENG